MYRVLEHVPRESLGKMYLVTADGKVLGLDAGAAPEEKGANLHLYQELCPLRPRVVSNLGPRAFGRKITDRGQPVSVDRIIFCELKLDGLGEDPEKAKADDLPYANFKSPAAGPFSRNRRRKPLRAGRDLPPRIEQTPCSS